MVYAGEVDEGKAQMDTADFIKHLFIVNPTLKLHIISSVIQKPGNCPAFAHLLLIPILIRGIW